MIFQKALNAVFRIDNEVKLISSSRTDAGVHAIRNTVHLDLDWGQVTQQFFYP